jgi:hypothetical protein
MDYGWTDFLENCPNWYACITSEMRSLLSAKIRDLGEIIKYNFPSLWITGILDTKFLKLVRKS